MVPFPPLLRPLFCLCSIPFSLYRGLFTSESFIYLPIRPSAACHPSISLLSLLATTSLCFVFLCCANAFQLLRTFVIAAPFPSAFALGLVCRLSMMHFYIPSVPRPRSFTSVAIAFSVSGLYIYSSQFVSTHCSVGRVQLHICVF